MYKDTFPSEEPLGSTKKTLIFNDSSNYKNISSSSLSFADAFLGKTPKINEETTTAKKKLFISEIGFPNTYISNNMVSEVLDNKENINSSKLLNKKWLKDPKARFSDVAFASEKYNEKRFESRGSDRGTDKTVKTKEEIKSKVKMNLITVPNSKKAHATTLFLFVFIAFLYYMFQRKEEEIIEKIFFCDSQSKLPFKPEKKCMPCPENAFCYDGKMMCLATYIEIKENRCVENTKINENADAFIKFISNFLASKCEDFDQKSYSFTEIRKVLSENFKNLNYFDDSFKKLQIKLNSYELRQAYSIGVVILDAESDEKKFHSTHKENSISKKLITNIEKMFKKKQAQIIYGKIKSLLEEKKALSIKEIKQEFIKNDKDESFFPLVDEIRIKDEFVSQNQEYLNGKLEFYWERKK